MALAFFLSYAMSSLNQVHFMRASNSLLIYFLVKSQFRTAGPISYLDVAHFPLCIPYLYVVFRLSSVFFLKVLKSQPTEFFLKKKYKPFSLIRTWMLKSKFHPQIFPLLQHGSSTQLTVFQDKPVPTWVLCGPHSLRDIHLPWHGAPPRAECGYLFHSGLFPGLLSVDLALLDPFPGAAWVSLLWCLKHLFPLLLHWPWCLQGCFSYCFPCPTSLAVVLLLNTSSQRCCLCGQGAQSCPVVGGMESSRTDHVQPRAIPASHHRSPRPGHWLFSEPGLVLSNSSGKWFVIFASLCPWFLMHVLGSCPIESGTVHSIPWASVPVPLEVRVALG